MDLQISPTRTWIFRDYIRCTGCRLCQIVCSLKHEGRIWPEASRIRVFMLVPGVEAPTYAPSAATILALPLAL